MSQGHMERKEPHAVEVVSGKTYYWCACGLSKKQPFCDGTHKGTEFSPVTFTPEKDKTVFLCGCRRSAKAPFCDGTHGKL